VAGWPTTAACPAYAYVAGEDAPVVAALREAGAIVVGKTNLDQFATGLVGVRTPWPVPRNPLDPARVPGGSSSGSAVAVARGIVTFALGTDTAGSGRVPAALNGNVVLKPTLGAISGRGVVPACRTLDTVSVFALTVADAVAAFRAAAVHDPTDPFARPCAVPPLAPPPPALRIGVPDSASLIFFGDLVQAAAFEATLDLLCELGATVREIDFTPFHQVADMLHAGGSGRRPGRAEHAAGDLYQFRQFAGSLWHCRARRAPQRRPARQRDPAGRGGARHAGRRACAGAATGGRRADGGNRPPPAPCPGGKRHAAGAGTGALHGRRAHGGAAAEPRGSRTRRALPANGAAWARLPAFRLAGPGPRRPGLVRVPGAGSATTAELWALPPAEVGSFLRGIPAPLGLGTVTLSDGSAVQGLLCETAGAAAALKVARRFLWTSLDEGDAGLPVLDAPGRGRQIVRMRWPPVPSSKVLRWRWVLTVIASRRVCITTSAPPRISRPDLIRSTMPPRDSTARAQTSRARLRQA